jgi:hypothetical protein
MAEVAVSQRMFAKILSLIARLRAPPPPARGLLGQIRQTTVGKVCLDVANPEDFSAAAR